MLQLFLWLSLSLVSWGQGNLAMKPNVRVIPIDGYAAQVNDRIITRSEVFARAAPILARLRQTYHGQELDQKMKEAYKKMCENMVDEILILSAFKELGGTVPDQYLYDEVQRVIRTRFKGDEAMFEQSLAYQKMTRSDYLQKLRDDMTVEIMLNQTVRKQARITPSKVREAYEKQKEKYYIPEKVYKQLKEGADFAELAKKVSEGARAAEGGTFPWMQPKDAREELQKTLHSLKVGTISPPIETKSAFYILKMHDRRIAHYQPFEKVRETIKRALEIEEQERLKKRWLKRLKEKNYVKIFKLK
jgi:parvulin-like peptidyl-prolyl isomerase